MKRIIFTLAIIGVSIGGWAQCADSTAVADTGWWARQPRWSLDLGISGGATLFTSNLDYTPYYSRYGLQLKVPLMLHCRVSPHWRLGAGVRYDLRFDPLHYAVKVNYLVDGDAFHTHGIDFEPNAVVGRQSGYALRNYIGIPLEATWYPWPREPRVLGLTFDIYAGYSFSSHIVTGRIEATRTTTGGTSDVSITDYSQSDAIYSGDPSLLPWKLELGVTLSTDVLGLIHGVRFFADLLPVYRVPATGENLYTAGMTIFL